MGIKEYNELMCISSELEEGINGGMRLRSKAKNPKSS